MTIRGSVDSLTADGAAGWAFGIGFAPGRFLVLQALLDGRVIGETTADQPRHDLAAAGLGDGRCGFTMAFYDAPVDQQLLPFISIRPRGGDVELPRTSLTGVGEYFGTIHARFPAAGRQRCVFGGLWTDRTDAARLLAGRVEVGATPPGVRGALQRIIGSGHAVLRDVVLPVDAEQDVLSRPDASLSGVVDPASGAAGRRFLAGVPELLFQPASLSLLKAMMDDTPVVHRVVLSHGEETGTPFMQPSAAERLPSPAESVLVVACLPTGTGSSLQVEIIAGSHEFPEFTADGRSRWLPSPPAGQTPPAIEIARRCDASIRMIEIGPQDLLILGPGTVYRLRPAGDQTSALQAWCIPSRISPSRVLEQPDAQTFVVRHPSGALLAV
ncbi:hypothetical protein EAH89_28970 [Roseomonas nepalensis]|uniref:Uncharacterized protein n=1 Tax=Muricoccus nepalensis TaxID=1854500 RepID=A0A502ET49_9PROT|nr:hypothetical protein [Roseomonas nepalensis]TPG40274.1 hypothetical protein EAH89_28970 [Roseomonas nepalensis]